MIELKDVGDGSEALLEVGNLKFRVNDDVKGRGWMDTNLLEVVAELHNRGLGEHPFGVHDELSVFQ